MHINKIFLKVSNLNNHIAAISLRINLPISHEAKTPLLYFEPTIITVAEIEILTTQL